MHLLAFVAHPDDEAYSFGGVIARAIARGHRATVLSATRGEQGPGYSGLPRGNAVAARRVEELAASCSALGAGPPEFLDLPDAGVHEAIDEPLVNRLAARFAQLSPDVILTHGEDGAYGHWDHLACTVLTGLALERMPFETRPRVLHAAFPRGLFLPVWQMMRRFRGGRLVAELEPDEIGTTADAVDLCVALTEEEQTAKRLAIASHASQMRDGDPGNFLSPGLTETTLASEWFVLAHGPPIPPGADDPFAGL